MKLKKPIVSLAIADVLSGDGSFFKFLSANDSGETESHQSGILVPLPSAPLLFDKPLAEKTDKWANIVWQDSLSTHSRFVFYESKNELRITNIGKKDSLVKPDMTGALFVLTKKKNGSYSAYFLNTERDIDDFMAALGLSTVQSGSLISTPSEANLELEIQKYVSTINGDFSKSEDVSAKAEEVAKAVFGDKSIDDPDWQLTTFVDVEYRIFKAIESKLYLPKVTGGFTDMNDFLALSNSIMNRRKSRAGKSLEHHLASLFIENGLKFTAQPTTEDHNTPDFIFPSELAYHDTLFPSDKLIFLGAKTTCKDRWRQITKEADRIETKYLCTLQQGISEKQMEQMDGCKVKLVVPKQYISMYPNGYRGQILSVKNFIGFAKTTGVAK
jgi:hypothetical protein